MANKLDIFGGHTTDTHCKHPLKAFQLGWNADTGNQNLVVTSYKVDHILKGYPIQKRYEPPAPGTPADVYVRDFIEIPCGHCISCRLRLSKEWANRMMLEAKEHESNYFLTLTYDNEHLPPPNPLTDDDGVVIGESPIHPLVLRDIQLFMKRLRKKYSDQTIRFYACGEYGSKNMRPHYHLILFGLKLPLGDLIEPDPEYGRLENELGQKYFVSQSISKLWDKGIHIITDVSWETCAYTARYCTKKLYGDEAHIYDDLNFPREFAVMSRKPGIGYNYFEKHKNMIYETDELFLNLGDKGGKKVKPPRYYDRLYDIDYPDQMNIIKLKRSELANENQKLRDMATSLGYEEQLAKEEHSLMQRASVLKRERGF